MTDIVRAIYELMGNGPSESPGPDGSSRHRDGSEKKSTESNVPSADDKIREKVDSIFSVSISFASFKLISLQTFTYEIKLVKGKNLEFLISGYQ